MDFGHKVPSLTLQFPKPLLVCSLLGAFSSDWSSLLQKYELLQAAQYHQMKAEVTAKERKETSSHTVEENFPIATVQHPFALETLLWHS